MITICSHDAGGAEILSSYIRYNKIECLFNLAGPAINIFQRKLGNIKNENIYDCINKSNQIICSMGWGSFEWQSLRIAKANKLNTIVYLDHWTKYSKRFSKNGVVVYPDEIWVGDNEAKKLAKSEFPSIPIKLVNNPYFIELKQELDSRSSVKDKNTSKITILYICEPTLLGVDNENNLDCLEHKALKYFLDKNSTIPDNNKEIILRPHPSESIDKYQWAINYNNISISVSNNKLLIEDIITSDLVVGRNSMALVVALLANKKVYSCIPPGGGETMLPFQEIRPFSEYINMNSNS